MGRRSRCAAFAGFVGIEAWQTAVSKAHKTRLAKANILYRFTVRLLHLAIRHGSVKSLENPHRSFWVAIFAIIKEQQDTELLWFWDSLTEVFFHNCCHGGQRRKGTRWKCTKGVFTALQAEAKMTTRISLMKSTYGMAQWAFDAAAEAAYPDLLTRRVQPCLRPFWPPQIFLLSPGLSQESVPLLCNTASTRNVFNLCQNSTFSLGS